MKTSSRSVKTIRILGISGSLRRESYNRSLLKAAIDLAPPELEIQIFDRLGEIPLYNQDTEDQGDPEVITFLKNEIRQADALLIVTPEYNYGIPGALKNAIDWVSRPPSESPLINKPAAVMGASIGAAGTARAQLSLIQSFVFTQTHVMLSPQVLVSQAHKKFDEKGTLIDSVTRNYVREFMSALVKWPSQIQNSKSHETEASDQSVA